MFNSRRGPFINFIFAFFFEKRERGARERAVGEVLGGGGSQRRRKEREEEKEEEEKRSRVFSFFFRHFLFSPRPPLPNCPIFHQF